MTFIHFANAVNAWHLTHRSVDAVWHSEATVEDRSTSCETIAAPNSSRLMNRFLAELELIRSYMKSDQTHKYDTSTVKQK
jgi:hypothetical protein